MHFLDYATGGLSPAASNGDMRFYDRRLMLGQRLAQPAPSRLGGPSFQSARNLLTEFLDYERRMQFVAEYLTKVDGATMFYALEARSPFLDHQLWELAARLTYSTRLQGGTLKAVLRAIVRNRISPEVASRRKQGFSVPVSRWLATGWKTQLEILREPTLAEEDGWIERGSVNRCLTEAMANGHVPTQLWRVLILEQWLRREQKGSTAAAQTPVGV
jgi:asparagine synthase (glutamine-hydrolysing)